MVRCVSRRMLRLALVLMLAGAGHGAAAAAEGEIAPASPWTSERLRNAQPKPLPEAGPAPPRPLTPLEAPRPVAGAPARAPTVDPGDALDRRLYRPRPEPPDGGRSPGARSQADAPLAPEAVGLSGASFTQSRVFPKRALRAFPYRAIGKLFAFDPGLGIDFTCSAFVIERRLIATAGHCVFDFAGRVGVAARDFLFIPAFDRGRAPFGAWTGTWARSAPSWRQGDGSVPHPADFGVVLIEDRRIGGRRVAIGDVTGVFGWEIQADVDQVALLGYPGNLDRGERLQQTHAGLFQAIPPNAVEFGSGQSGGASGGPIVEDLGVPARGQPQTANRVIGVISFGTDEAWTLGGSVLNRQFNDLIDLACRQRRGSCLN